MDEIKLGISDFNKSFLEGRVIGSPNTQETVDGRAVINFTLEVMKFGSRGEKRYNHNISIFSKTAEIYGPYIKNDVFMRLTGHLISQSMIVGTGTGVKNINFSKFVADYVELEA